MKDEKNEFEDLEEEVPKDFSELPDNNNQDSMIDRGTPGVIYDWSKAPEGVKAPPRIDLGGKSVKIKKADIILPPKNREWEKTKSGDKEFKYCTFILYYDIDGQQEFYSGVRVFKRDEDKYSHPTITRDRKNQASELLGLYADFKGLDINEVSLRSFMGGLNSQPTVMIKSVEVKNPTTGETVKKNLVGEFVK